MFENEADERKKIKKLIVFLILIFVIVIVLLIFFFVRSHSEGFDPVINDYNRRVVKETVKPADKEEVLSVEEEAGPEYVEKCNALLGQAYELNGGSQKKVIVFYDLRDVPGSNANSEPGKGIYLYSIYDTQGNQVNAYEAHYEIGSDLKTIKITTDGDVTESTFEFDPDSYIQIDEVKYEIGDASAYGD